MYRSFSRLHLSPVKDETIWRCYILPGRQVAPSPSSTLERLYHGRGRTPGVTGKKEKKCSKGQGILSKRDICTVYSFIIEGT